MGDQEGRLGLSSAVAGIVVAFSRRVKPEILTGESSSLSDLGIGRTTYPPQK